jgi:hypothetical protein
MSEWRVDPDGVLGVLKGLDDTAPYFERSRDAIEEAAFEGGVALVADGRRVLASAWNAFLEDRRLVPGKIMYAVNAAADAVGAATIAVVTGDETMADDLRAAEYAWRDSSPAVYGGSRITAGGCRR